MSSSPKEPNMNNTTPYVNRYSERYKSLLAESPPRDFNTQKTPISSTLKNSPLQSNREQRVFEGEKYTTLKVKNEDRGEWRENTMFNEENVDEVEQVRVTKPSSPYQTTTTTTVIEKETVAVKSTPPPPIQRKSVREASYRQEEEQQHRQTPQPQPQQHRRSLPHYMQATSSFESRVHSTKERRSHSNLLGPRSKGGITKRVGTTKIPRYQATTTINAIEDIQSEMLPDDVYVPMAARIKLFEKGLGNGSNKPVPVARQSSSSSSTSNSQPRPSRSTSTRISPTPLDSSLPSYARGTVASETKERTRKSRTTTPAKSIIKSSERDKSFNEKLNLWKGKDKIATMESHNRGIKRKNEQTLSNRHLKK